MLSPRTAAAEAHMLWACALRQEKPAQVEKARTRQQRPSAIRMINKVFMNKD